MLNQQPQQQPNQDDLDWQEIDQFVRKYAGPLLLGTVGTTGTLLALILGGWVAMPLILLGAGATYITFEKQLKGWVKQHPLTLIGSSLLGFVTGPIGLVVGGLTGMYLDQISPREIVKNAAENAKNAAENVGAAAVNIPAMMLSGAANSAKAKVFAIPDFLKGLIPAPLADAYEKISSSAELYLFGEDEEKVDIDPAANAAFQAAIEPRAPEAPQMPNAQLEQVAQRDQEVAHLAQEPAIPDQQAQAAQRMAAEEAQRQAQLLQREAQLIAERVEQRAEQAQRDQIMARQAPAILARPVRAQREGARARQVPEAAPVVPARERLRAPSMSSSSDSNSSVIEEASNGGIFNFFKGMFNHMHPIDDSGSEEQGAQVVKPSASRSQTPAPARRQQPMRAARRQR